MSKKRSADEQKPAKWIKFIGVNAEHWRKILDQVSIESIPYEFVDEIRLHYDDGRTVLYDSTKISEKKAETIVDDALFYEKRLNAVEYVIDLDKIHDAVIDQVKIFIERSKE